MNSGADLVRNGRGETILGTIRQLFDGGSFVGLGDGALLERFVRFRDEPAFEALMIRLGPMVLGVCRRSLEDPADVEDAFQATFLILVRKAPGIRDRDHLGPWVYGVARRVALRARAQRTRRRTRERMGQDPPAEVTAPTEGGQESRELREALEDEVARLPAKYRAPIVLCYLEGLTHEQTAARLRWPVGTVRSRMAWARGRLRTRLERRGWTGAEGLMGAAWLPRAVPEALTRRAMVGAVRLLAGRGVAGAVSAEAWFLARRVGWTMIGNPLKSVVSLVIAAGVISGGAIVVARQIGGEPRRSAIVKGDLIEADPQAKPVALPDVESRDGEADPGPTTLLDRIEALEQRQGELEREVQAMRQVVGGGPNPRSGKSPKPPEMSGMRSGASQSGIPGGGGGGLGAPTSPIPKTAQTRIPGGGGGGLGAPNPPIQKATQNLKRIGLALHNFAAASPHNSFPPRAISDPQGKPLLSWRVAILPYLEGSEGLFKEFHRDEPWNSPHNTLLLNKMPKVFEVPGDPGSRSASETYYLGLSGEHAAFEPALRLPPLDGQPHDRNQEGGVALSEITDGMSNTLAVVEAARSVPWTKPEDLDADDLLKATSLHLKEFLGHHVSPDGPMALFLDGRVRWLKSSMDVSRFKPLITRDGGEIVDAGGLD